VQQPMQVRIDISTAPFSSRHGLSGLEIACHLSTLTMRTPLTKRRRQTQFEQRSAVVTTTPP
jgi:hypothetical protein